MQLIVALIVKNQIGSGASIEKVVSEAEKRGIDKEQLLCDFQHLKMHFEHFQKLNCPDRGFLENICTFQAYIT
jgi:hypothetical protein